MSRRVSREELFKLIFEIELNESDIESNLNDYLGRDDKKLLKTEIEFIEKYAKGLATHSDEIMETLKNNITGWSLERVGNIEKALLKIATYEILYENTPTEIIINEVVELAKIYGDNKSHEFINGVLAKIITEKNNK